MPRLINNVAVSRSFWSKNTYFIFSDIKNGPLFEIGQETIHQIKLATLKKLNLAFNTICKSKVSFYPLNLEWNSVHIWVI